MSDLHGAPDVGVRSRPRRAGLDGTLIIVCQSMQALAFGGVALFLPLIRADLGISFSEAGVLGSATTLTYAIMQVPAGMIADRVDPKRLFIAGLVGVNLLSITFAVVDSFSAMVVIQALSGVFRAFVFAPGLLLMVRLFRADRRATAMGLYVAGGFSSNILLNALGPVLVEIVGWRWLIAGFAASGLVVLAVFARVGGTAVGDQNTSEVTRSALIAVLRHRVVLLCGYIQFVRLAIVTGTAFWLPSLLVDDKGYSLVSAGAVVALGAALTAPSNFLGGLIADRTGRPLTVIATSMVMLASSLIAMALLDHGALLVAVIAINAVFIQLYFGPLFAIPWTYVSVENGGLVSGFGNLCANVGGFVSSLALGAIKDATGSFAVGLWAMALLCVSALAAVRAISRANDNEETS